MTKRSRRFKQMRADQKQATDLTKDGIKGKHSVLAYQGPLEKRPFVLPTWGFVLLFLAAMALAAIVFVILRMHALSGSPSW